MNRPSAKSRVSPGRNGKNSPHSTKMMTQAEPEQRPCRTGPGATGGPSSPCREATAGGRRARSDVKPTGRSPTGWHFAAPRLAWQDPSDERAPYDPMPHGPPEVGVGPVAGSVARPGRSTYDPELLREGDRRNVVDRYRYWTMEAIVADLDTRRHDFHVAIENWQHDFNIGTIVRTANAFLAAEVHIVGNRRWNRRGAMVTDRYQHVRHHADGRRPGGVPPRPATAPSAARHRQPARLRAPRDDGAAARGSASCSVRRGPGLSESGPRGLRRHVLDRAVRLDPLDQRLAPPRRSRCTPGSGRTPTSARRLAGLAPQ